MPKLSDNMDSSKWLYKVVIHMAIWLIALTIMGALYVRGNRLALDGKEYLEFYKEMVGQQAGEGYLKVNDKLFAVYPASLDKSCSACHGAGEGSRKESTCPAKEESEIH